MSEQILEQLVSMSHFLGQPEHHFAILGEGNTSARLDDSHFYIKASGTTLQTIRSSDFLCVRMEPVLSLLDNLSATDEDVLQTLQSSKTNVEDKRMPSVETILHAVLYQYPQYMFIGHTHPIFVNSILCSQKAEEYIQGRTCPDHIVVVGSKSVYIPYVDPGLTLARVVRDKVQEFVATEGFLPKAIFMENHGLIAMGPTPSKVQAITLMAEKCAQIVVGSAFCGGPKFLSDSAVRRIDTRPDEHYRQKLL
ncbi:MAG TPA: class II aldolase/adducin family protein [Candidatus Hydrogenedens sp.]|nr:class II aldolase/adducin family protein [Candidatus Hydrogenedens sp.]HOL20508.1 class II aldolase/adducin family protein [Candidatus Hydrogenedens sp.]HPP59973.1 class II aldolase/adducin family protein [Candidatus Hydrogenedens sp.]